MQRRMPCICEQGTAYVTAYQGIASIQVKPLDCILASLKA